MTSGRQRVLARKKALAKWIKGKTIQLVDNDVNCIKIFKVGFNMGWKSHRDKNERKII